MRVIKPVAQSACLTSTTFASLLTSVFGQQMAATRFQGTEDEVNRDVFQIDQLQCSDTLLLNNLITGSKQYSPSIILHLYPLNLNPRI